MPSDRVDRENKIIRGYKVMSLGEAKGHGMLVDETTLEQLVALGNAADRGIKTRIRHPDPAHDGFGRTVGKSKNFRREKDGVFADLHLSEAAFVSPEGDLGTYLMQLADSDDDTFGASPEIRHTKQNIPGAILPAMRLKALPAVAIVDDPATNKGFFSCLSAGEEDMADDSKAIGELTAERDLLAEQAVQLKAKITTLEADATAKAAAHVAELSTVRTDTITAERNRVNDILALCSKANRAELSAKYIADGTSKADLQTALLDVLCLSNKPVGEGGGAADLGSAGDENAKYKAEFLAAKPTYLSQGFDEASYVAMRRVDDGLELLTTKKAA